MRTRASTLAVQPIRWSVNTSIYIDADHQPSRERVDACTNDCFRSFAEQGYRMAHAGITLPNRCQRRRFTNPSTSGKIGVYQNVGFKFGASGLMSVGGHSTCCPPSNRTLAHRHANSIPRRCKRRLEIGSTRVPSCFPTREEIDSICSRVVSPSHGSQARCAHLPAWPDQRRSGRDYHSRRHCRSRENCWS